VPKAQNNEDEGINVIKNDKDDVKNLKYQLIIK
jgi:hypothetical protein